MTVAQQIAQGARQRGLDPRAVLAVAGVEGGFGGAVGDQGTSYGPFQLHVGGALPRGRGNQWANSPQGIAYALNAIAKIARGLHGQQAVGAIVNRFERPAHPGAEVQRAMGRYGQTLGGGLVGSASVGPAAPQAPAAPVGPQQTGMALIQALQAGPQHGDYGPVYQAIQQRIHAAAQTDAQGVADHIARSTQPGSSAPLGRVTLRLGADRPGVRTSPTVLQFVRKIAGLARTPLTIGAGSNHSEMTVNGRVSDHWSGHAADIPATGYELVHLGRLALIAAGANPRWAMKQTGGLFNVGGHQIIFNTHIGGDHTNHLHVSAY
jgi:hypothetical protein